MRGLSSKESDYSDMNIPLTAADDHYAFEGSNNSLSSHSRYPPDSPSYSSPNPNQPPSNNNSSQSRRSPSAFSNFLSNFTGPSTANQGGIRTIYLNNTERNA